MKYTLYVIHTQYGFRQALRIVSILVLFVDNLNGSNLHRFTLNQSQTHLMLLKC